MNFPVKPAKKTKPTRLGAAFVIQRDDGAIWLTKRPSSGLLADMSTLPTSQWTASVDGATGAQAGPVQADWQSFGKIRHTFTHFHLELEVWGAICNQIPGAGWWSLPNEIGDEALPTVMKKAVTAAVPDAFKVKA